ncbi:RidA family protein [Natrarchaeobaculum aegyptiacum]|nr:RidA family protein [Natrarchaeobaculum aegyptiacum]
MAKDVGRTSAEVTRLSSESRRQREGSSNVGAFGSRTGDSDLVFLEGILPESNGTMMSDRSIDEQTVHCFDRLEEILAARGLDRSSVVKVTVQVTDPVDLSAVNDVYRERFDGAYPPRTTVGVSWLPGDAGVQFDVIAAAE